MGDVSNFDVGDRDAVRAALLKWYDGARRDLPWRARPGAASDPYHVWLSEIMLQQTTVPHATPYFLSFLDRWPTVADLAAAEDGAVMAAWAGLGYYARARNLLACARVVAAAHGGRFPPSEADLRKLPGVGAYTAAAIAAIAFGEATNVVDGNVERVMSRLFAVETPLPAAKSELHALAGGFVRTDRPGDWAQALMDLGSGVCRPKTPDCANCPIAFACRAQAMGEAAGFPRRSAKVERPHRHGAVYLMWRGRRVALVRRPDKGLLGGMLGLPTSPWGDGPLSELQTQDAAPVSGAWLPAGTVNHVFTHFSLTLAVRELQLREEATGFIWMTRDEAMSALPSVFRKAFPA